MDDESCVKCLHLKTFNLEKTAVSVSVKDEYIKRGFRCHPERVKTPEAEEEFKKLTESCYFLLSDPTCYNCVNNTCKECNANFELCDDYAHVYEDHIQEGDTFEGNYHELLFISILGERVRKYRFMPKKKRKAKKLSKEDEELFEFYDHLVRVQDNKLGCDACPRYRKNRDKEKDEPVCRGTGSEMDSSASLSNSCAESKLEPAASNVEQMTECTDPEHGGCQSHHLRSKVTKKSEGRSRRNKRNKKALEAKRKMEEKEVREDLLKKCRLDTSGEKTKKPHIVLPREIIPSNIKKEIERQHREAEKKKREHERRLRELEALEKKQIKKQKRAEKRKLLESKTGEEGSNTSNSSLSSSVSTSNTSSSGDTTVSSFSQDSSSNSNSSFSPADDTDSGQMAASSKKKEELHLLSKHMDVYHEIMKQQPKRHTTQQIEEEHKQTRQTALLHQSQELKKMRIDDSVSMSHSGTDTSKRNEYLKKLQEKERQNNMEEEILLKLKRSRLWRRQQYKAHGPQINITDSQAFAKTSCTQPSPPENNVWIQGIRSGQTLASLIGKASHGSNPSETSVVDLTPRSKEEEDAMLQQALEISMDTAESDGSQTKQPDFRNDSFQCSSCLDSALGTGEVKMYDGDDSASVDMDFYRESKIRNSSRNYMTSTHKTLENCNTEPNSEKGKVRSDFVSKQFEKNGPHPLKLLPVDTFSANSQSLFEPGLLPELLSLPVQCPPQSMPFGPYYNTVEGVSFQPLLPISVPFPFRGLKKAKVQKRYTNFQPSMSSQSSIQDGKFSTPLSDSESHNQDFHFWGDLKESRSKTTNFASSKDTCLRVKISEKPCSQARSKNIPPLSVTFESSKSTVFDKGPDLICSLSSSSKSRADGISCSASNVSSVSEQRGNEQATDRPWQKKNNVPDWWDEEAGQAQAKGGPSLIQDYVPDHWDDDLSSCNDDSEGKVEDMTSSFKTTDISSSTPYACISETSNSSAQDHVLKEVSPIDFNMEKHQKNTAAPLSKEASKVTNGRYESNHTQQNEEFSDKHKLKQTGTCVKASLGSVHDTIIDSKSVQVQENIPARRRRRAPMRGKGTRYFVNSSRQERNTEPGWEQNTSKLASVTSSLDKMKLDGQMVHGKQDLVESKVSAVQLKPPLDTGITKGYLEKIAERIGLKSSFQIPIGLPPNQILPYLMYLKETEDQDKSKYSPIKTANNLASEYTVSNNSENNSREGSEDSGVHFNYPSGSDKNIVNGRRENSKAQTLQFEHSGSQKQSTDTLKSSTAAFANSHLTEAVSSNRPDVLPGQATSVSSRAFNSYFAMPPGVFSSNSVAQNPDLNFLAVSLQQQQQQLFLMSCDLQAKMMLLAAQAGNPQDPVKSGPTENDPDPGDGSEAATGKKELTEEQLQALLNRLPSEDTGKNSMKKGHISVASLAASALLQNTTASHTNLPGCMRPKKSAENRDREIDSVLQQLSSMSLNGEGNLKCSDPISESNKGKILSDKKLQAVLKKVPPIAAEAENWSEGINVNTLKNRTSSVLGQRQMNTATMYEHQPVHSIQDGKADVTNSKVPPCYVNSEKRELTEAEIQHILQTFQNQKPMSVSSMQKPMKVSARTNRRENRSPCAPLRKPTTLPKYQPLATNLQSTRSRSVRVFTARKSDPQASNPACASTSSCQQTQKRENVTSNPSIARRPEDPFAIARVALIQVRKDSDKNGSCKPGRKPVSAVSSFSLPLSNPFARLSSTKKLPRLGSETDDIEH